MSSLCGGSFEGCEDDLQCLRCAQFDGFCKWLGTREPTSVSLRKPVIDISYEALTSPSALLRRQSLFLEWIPWHHCSSMKPLLQSLLRHRACKLLQRIARYSGAWSGLSKRWVLYCRKLSSTFTIPNTSSATGAKSR